MSERRKTLRDYASESAGSGGIECPRCGCADFYVEGTRSKRTATFRYKSCRNCGHRILTATTSQERIVRVIDTDEEEATSPDLDKGGPVSVAMHRA